jgi:hypothetical protein
MVLAAGAALFGGASHSLGQNPIVSTFNVPVVGRYDAWIRIPPNEQAATLSLPIDYAKRMSVQMVATFEDDVVSVELPNPSAPGQPIVLTPCGAPSPQCVDFTRLTPALVMASVTPETPLLRPLPPGPWQILALTRRTSFTDNSTLVGNHAIKVAFPEGRANPDGEMVRVAITYTGGVAAAAQAVPRSLAAGSPVLLTVALVDGGQLVTGSTVTAAAAPETGTGRTFTLNDLGQGGDSVANDGVYSIAVSDLSVGKYIVRFDISGQTLAAPDRPSVEFRRTAFCDLDVVTPAASFAANGAFTDASEDLDADGLFDRIRISYPVTVLRPADYEMRVVLKVPGSGETLTAIGTARLTAGNQTMNAYLPASDIWALKKNGPYTIASAELFVVSDDGRAELGYLIPTNVQTAPYQYIFAQRPAIDSLGVYVPGVRAVDWDEPLDSVIDLLEVPVLVDVAHGGQYRVQAYLTLDCGARVAFADKIVTLLAPADVVPIPGQAPQTQLITLEFDGYAIGSSGVRKNGTVGVRDLQIWSPRGSVFHDRVGNFSLPALPSNVTYPGQRPFPDVNRNGSHDACDIFLGRSQDEDRNGIPDEAQSNPCSPADIADNGANPGPDGSVDNGDFGLFITLFFTTGATCNGTVIPCNAADIADNGSLFCPDGLLDNGDFSLFISSFFAGGCTYQPSDCVSGLRAGGSSTGQVVSESQSMMRSAVAQAASAGLTPAEIQSRLNALQNLGRPMTADDVRAMFPEAGSGGTGDR